MIDRWVNERALRRAQTSAEDCRVLFLAGCRNFKWKILLKKFPVPGTMDRDREPDRHQILTECSFGLARRTPPPHTIYCQKALRRSRCEDYTVLNVMYKSHLYIAYRRIGIFLRQRKEPRSTRLRRWGGDGRCRACQGPHGAVWIELLKIHQNLFVTFLR